jgi:hypothetical protein
VSSDEPLPPKQQKIINLLRMKGWKENGAPNRLKKGFRRVFIGVKQTTFSVRHGHEDTNFENLQTKDFEGIKAKA